MTIPFPAIPGGAWPGLVTPGDPGTTSLAPVPAIRQVVTGTTTFDYGWSTVQMTTIAGNTLVVLAGWDLSTSPAAAAMPAVNVADSAGNWWVHVATSTSSVTGSRSAAFICVNALPITWLSVSLTTFASSLAYTVAELANMPLYCSLDVSAANAASLGTSLTVDAGTTSVADIAFSVLATGGTPAAPATPAGWLALNMVTAGAGAQSPVTVFPFWRNAAAATSMSVTYTVSQALPLSGVTFAIKATASAPVPVNANFPDLLVEAGFGSLPGDPSQPPPSWTDITARAIAPDGQVYIRSAMGHEYELATPEAGELAISGDNHDGAFTPGNSASQYAPNVVALTPIRVSALWSGRWYHVAYGYVQSWPQEWPHLPQWGISTFKAADPIAVLTSDTMISALDGDMLLDAPYLMLPASEQYTLFLGGLNPSRIPADAQGLLAANISRASQRAGTYVDGTAATADTGQATGMLGDSDSGFGTSSITTAPTIPVSGPGIAYTDPGLPSPLSANGVTVEFWVVITATVSAASLQPVVFSAYGPPSNYRTAHPSLQVLVSNYTASTLTVTLADGTTVTAAFTASADPQQVVLTLTSSALQVYVNGALSASASLTATQVTAWRATTLGCPNYAYQAGSVTAGNFVAFDFAVYPYILPAQRISSHYVTGLTGQQNVDATTRIAQILSWAGLGIARAGQVLFSGASDGVTQGPAYDLEGGTAADAVSQVAVNHGALVAAAPSGALVFMHKWALFNQAPVAVIGDAPDPAAGEVPFLQASSYDYDTTYLYNSDQVTQSQGPNTTLTVTAADFASQHSYFPRTALTQSISTMSDLDVYDAANWNVAKYSQPALRVKGVTIDAASNPALAFPVVLALQQGQVATVTRRPLGGAVISAAFIVQKIEHEIGPGVWKTSLQLSPYKPEDAVFTLGAGGYSTLGSNTLA